MNFKRFVEADNSWVDSHYIKKTDTDIITTLPATIYPLAQSVTIGLKGNTVQNGTPTPSAPVPVVGVGDLDNGQYKIPISSANTTTPVYLGEVESTRKIGKYECTGNETWQVYSSSDGTYGVWQFFANGLVNGTEKTSAYSNVAEYGVTSDNRTSHQYGVYLVTSGTGIAFQMAGAKDTFQNLTAWKSYLQQQYAAGTPVTVWYILATETTGIVNEPLMKIGDYADSISGISIPTTAGANTLDVQTALKPSEVTANFNGWHPVSSAHERSGGSWT